MAFIEIPACYLALPAGEEFAPVRKAILDGLSGLNIEVLEASSVPSRGAVRGPSGRGSIERADFVIADVTGGDRTILYELGAANALRKPTLLIAQQQTDIPEELASLQVILYKPEEKEDLMDYVRHWMRSQMSVLRRKYEPAAG